MKVFEKVQGSKEAARELIVDEGNVVYVHSNIRKIPAEELIAKNPDMTEEELAETELYEYDEIQYTKDEYIHFIGEENKTLNNNITDLELAITELYEGGLI